MQENFLKYNMTYQKALVANGSIELDKTAALYHGTLSPLHSSDVCCRLLASFVNGLDTVHQTQHCVESNNDSKCLIH